MNPPLPRHVVAWPVLVAVGALLVRGTASMAAPPAPDAPGQSAAQTFSPYAAEPGGREETVTVSVADAGAALRTFTLASTMAQRDDAPATRTLREVASQPRVRSGDLLFDALFAMAVDDMLLDSVSEIRDGAYNDGEPIGCDCFQTGEKWHYVWTRDLSYAANLALAHLDPPRVVRSLLFKTSGFREGVMVPATLPAGSTQIIQDTGSGGSWPVSTDRVSWAFAADSVLNSLAGDARAAFSRRAYAALRGTVEADREAAFDSGDGLYGGEQSYLDWRTQTYAPWIVRNLSHMSSSKALSTNVAHHQALRLAARLAREHGEAATAARYVAWADDLARAINAKFWLGDVGLYASLTNPGRNPAPVYKYDMLGTALVVLSGIAPADRAREVLAKYPHAPFGVPVYYPHQPGVYVYHNRALWPFVTAYALKAAARVENPRVADNAIHSLMRGAALNLSNMENLEWLTGKPWYDDGPAINSRRQLWSVAGYLGMVMETIFGYHVDAEGIRIEPFLTTATRKLLGTGATATLENVTHQGRTMRIVLELPAAADRDGFHSIASVRLNGRDVRGPITSDALRVDGANTVSVSFGGIVDGDARITQVPAVDPSHHHDPRVFAPASPRVTAITLRDNHFTVSFTDDDKAATTDDEVRYAIYRDGRRVDPNVTTSPWTDPEPAALGRRVSYAVEARFQRSGHRSHHSEPFFHDEGAREVIPVTDGRVRSNVAVTPPSDGIGQPTLRTWGKPGDILTVTPVTTPRPGKYAIAAIYNNHAHTIDSGVTNAVKRLRLLDTTGREIARGILQMPNVEQEGDTHPLRPSTEVVLDLPAGTWRLELEDYFNMSSLEANRSYSGNGGRNGPVNTTSIAAFTITVLAPADRE